jgi:hypothetical protein
MNFERTECQYCGDSGLCEFCERGKLVVAEYLKKQKEGSVVNPINESPEKDEREIETKIKIVPVEERDDNWESLMGGGN